VSNPPVPLLRSRRFYAAMLGLFLLGCATPALEASFPKRYDDAKREAMIAMLLQSEQLSQTQRNDVSALISQGAIAYAGRALYPRYFASNVGNPGVGKTHPFAPKPYPRMGFYLAGSQNETLSIPVEGSSSFPSGQDVLVIGCNTRDLLLVARFSTKGTIDGLYLRSFLPSRLDCPLPAIPETNN
jgi:hypothetical protein